MAKKNLASVTADLAALAEGVPTQHVARPKDPAHDGVLDETPASIGDFLLDCGGPPSFALHGITLFWPFRSWPAAANYTSLLASTAPSPRKVTAR